MCVLNKIGKLYQDWFYLGKREHDKQAKCFCAIDFKVGVVQVQCTYNCVSMYVVYYSFILPYFVPPSSVAPPLNNEYLYMCIFNWKYARVFWNYFVAFLYSIIVNIIFILQSNWYLFDQRLQKLRQKSKCFCATHFKACSLFAPILKLKMKYYLPK